MLCCLWSKVLQQVAAGTALEAFSVVTSQKRNAEVNIAADQYRILFGDKCRSYGQSQVSRHEPARFKVLYAGTLDKPLLTGCT